MTGADDLLVELTSVAEACEATGRLNLGKVCRAAEHAVRLGRANAARVDDPRPELAARLRRAGVRLEDAGGPPELVERLRTGAVAVERGGALRAWEYADPLGCRRCGWLARGEDDACPRCGAHPLTFRRHRAVYWLTEYRPREVVEQLGAAPERIGAALRRLPEDALTWAPRPGAWSATEVLRHLRDSQLLLSRRVTLLLTEPEPSLMTRGDPPPEPAEPVDVEAFRFLAQYRASRAATIEVLSGVTSAQWERAGWHVEYGRVTLAEQSSYFAAHELTHLRQLEALRRAAQDPPPRSTTR